MTEHEFYRNEIATPEQLPDVESQATPMPPSAHNAAPAGLEQPAVPPILENPATEPPPVKPLPCDPDAAPTAIPHTDDKVSETPTDDASGELVNPVKRRRGRPKRQDSAAMADATASEEVGTSSPPSPPDGPPALTVTANSAADDDNDPFSPRNLAITQNFTELTETKRLLTSVRVGKPNREAWFRASTNPEHWIVGTVLELKGVSEETFWVTHSLRDELSGEPCVKLVRLILCVDRAGNPFFLKAAHTDPHGRSQPWAESLLEAATAAKTMWVRVVWSQTTRCYEVSTAAIQAEPKWPTESIHELLRIAFRGRVIDTLDHPVIRQLRGLE